MKSKYVKSIIELPKNFKGVYVLEPNTTYVLPAVFPTRVLNLKWKLGRVKSIKERIND